MGDDRAECPDIRAQQLAQARGFIPEASDYPEAVATAWTDLQDWEELPAPTREEILRRAVWISAQKWPADIAAPAKHQFKRLRDGQVDNFAHEAEADFGGHNGPRCEVCGTAFCEHCTPDRYDEECPGVWVE